MVTPGKPSRLGGTNAQRKLMQPCPNTSIAGIPQLSLQPQGAHLAFLAHHVQICPQPKPQWLSDILKYSPHSQSDLAVAQPTSIQAFHCSPCLPMTTSTTAKPIRPAEVKQVLAAAFPGGKGFLKVEERRRVVFHF